VKALTQLGKLKQPERFMSWLFKTTKNLFLDQVKSPASKAHENLDDVADSPDAPVAPGGDPGFSVHFQQALNALPEQDRLILLLVDMEERSYAEAAEVAGITESTLRFRLHHIRKEFKKLYER
jgi:RNA polymerase sigma-70 factor (ECF subfamily)